MESRQTLKEELPPPYNHDLSKVLRHLNRRLPFSRKRLANSPTTASFLYAAMRLVRRQLGPEAERTLTDPADDASIERPLLGFLSQRAVETAVRHNPSPFPRRGKVSTMRSTWRHHSDFIADLVRFALWVSHYPAAHQEEVSGPAEQALAGPDPAQAIHRIAYWDLTRLIRTPEFRLGVIAAAAAEGDEAIEEAIADLRQHNVASWTGTYASFLQARGLQLRGGITLDELAVLLGSLASGLALRAISDPGAGVLDHQRKRSLLGTAVLALILGCLERPGDSGLTLEQAVQAYCGATPASGPPGRRSRRAKRTTRTREPGSASRSDQPEAPPSN